MHKNIEVQFLMSWLCFFIHSCLHTCGCLVYMYWLAPIMDHVIFVLLAQASEQIYNIFWHTTYAHAIGCVNHLHVLVKKVKLYFNLFDSSILCCCIYKFIIFASMHLFMQIVCDIIRFFFITTVCKKCIFCV